MPPPPPAFEADCIGEKLKLSRRIHWLDQRIGDSDSDNDTILIKDFKRERANLLADQARVPWKRRAAKQCSNCEDCSTNFHRLPEG